MDTNEQIKINLSNPPIDQKYIRRPYFWFGVFIQGILTTTHLVYKKQFLSLFSAFQEKTGLSYLFIINIICIFCLIILAYYFKKRDISLQKNSLTRRSPMKAAGKMILGLFLGYFLVSILFLILFIGGIGINCILLQNNCL